MLSWAIPNLSAPPVDAPEEIVDVGDKGLTERLWLYGRFFLAPVAILIAIPMMMFTVYTLAWYVVTLIVVALVVEFYSKPDYTQYIYPHAGEIFYPLQYFSIFVGCVTIMVLAWRLGIYHGHNFLWISSLVGEQGVAHIIEHSTFSTWVACFAVAGGAAGMNSIAIGHELTHRTESPTCVLIGRFGQTFGQYTSFGIRHPYGHHNLVCTPVDSSTAMRGSSFYAFASRSILGQYVHAWELERERLGRKGKGPWSTENRILMGWVAEGVVAVIFIYLAGWVGLGAIFLIRMINYIALEFANYIEHYGLLRVPNEAQQVRHAWDAYRRLSYWGSVAISRHANHHANASVEFWDLAAYNKQGRKDTPTMFGDSYLFAILLALCPPLWHRVYNQRLIDWDLNMASDEEKGLAYWNNIRSGQKALIEHAELNLKAYADKAMA